jgi:hypothetical protein
LKEEEQCSTGSKAHYMNMHTEYQERPLLERKIPENNKSLAEKCSTASANPQT